MCESNLVDELKALSKDLNIQEISEVELPCFFLLEPFFANLDTCTLSGSYVKIQAVLDYMNEKINIGNWKCVRLYIRKTITFATYFKVMIHVLTKKSSDNNFFKEAIKIIDHGLLFGCPIDTVPELLQNCAVILTKHYPENVPDPSFQNKTIAISDEISIETNIDALDCPSMEHFYTNYILAEKPAILKNCMNHWPAMHKWQDISYITKVGGLRTVPVELGSKYTDSEWTQKLMTIEDFVKEYIFENNETKGYLAQYQLFEHIPQLRDDICEPEYCCFSDKDEKVDVNAWFGPQGTVSPLHYDPKRNLLTQVVGSKKIILFSPKDTEYLYPHTDEMLFNTARVDPRQPDYETYPLFKSATPYTCVLNSGDMLYIPPKWWHFVESLSISFSVSFWWS